MHTETYNETDRKTDQVKGKASLLNLKYHSRIRSLVGRINLRKIKISKPHCLHAI